MNKKRITALFLALMMVLALPVQSFAQDVTDFTFQADTGTITKYTGTARRTGNGLDGGGLHVCPYGR
ncbi:MAG: hypothetical protein ACOX00_03430 [Peptoniphilaceae bacterium]|jgi:hypothetical protein